MTYRRPLAVGENSVDEARPAPQAASASAEDPSDLPFRRAARELPRRLDVRERLFRRGPSVLSAVELLVLTIGGRSGGRSGHRETPELARDLMRRHGVEGLARMSPRDWAREAGVGRATAGRLAAAFELGRRAWSDAASVRPRVGSPREAWAQVRDIGKLRKEHLVGLYLDAQNRLLCRETISVGSLNTTRTHPREIFYPAVEHLALGFILAHNHPSGSREPSDEDVEFTRGVRRAAELMGIDLYDHLIVTRDGYTSLRERGAL